MIDSHDFDFVSLAEPVARALLGEPTKHLSKPSELRFGTNGSLKVSIAGKAAGTFSDFETQASGGLLDLISHVEGCDRKSAIQWLSQRFGPISATKNATGKIVAVYPYLDESGERLFEVVRKEPKAFLQRRSEDDYSVKGVRQVPYRLPEITEAIATGRVVFIVEGEKDADNLAAHGAHGTCNAGGAGKWRDEHSECLRGADVVIIPDADKAGEDHAEKVAKSLKGVASRIRILRLIGVDRKGDVSDWFAAGHSIERLYELVEAAPDWRPASRLPLTWLGDEDRVPPRSWLVKGFLSRGDLSIVHAPSGGGKSFFALDLAARIAAGMPWFDRAVFECPVLYIAAEGSTGFRLRMKAWRQKHSVAAGAPFVMMAQAINLLDPKSDALEAVTDAIAEIREHTGQDVGLVVLDTLSRMMPGGVDSEPRDVKSFLENTERVRAATSAHIMVIHHSGKEIERGMRGSSMLRDYADTVIEIEKGEGDAPLSAIVKKQKDGEDGQRYRFNLQQSTVGVDEDGDDITSCVLDPIGASEGNDPAIRPRLNAREELARRCLADLLAEDGVTSVTCPKTGHVTRRVTLDQWREELRNRLGMESDSAFRKAWERLKNNLLARAVIRIDGGMTWLL